MIRRAWVLLLGAVLGGSFYLLLVDIAVSPELYVLAAVAIACGVALEVSREQGFVEARLRPRWLLGSWSLLFKIVTNIVILCWEALRQLTRPRGSRGQFRAVRFKATRQTPEDTGRRALTEWLGSVAPNTIVVGVDADRGLLLVHQLRREGETNEIDPLGLG